MGGVLTAGSAFNAQLWLLLICLLAVPCLGQVVTVHSPKIDRPPRAALVSLAQEHELGGVLQSINQLEKSFNSRYHYHWVFFSTEILSENFRRLTSNATNATCIYELIPEESGTLITSAKVDANTIAREEPSEEFGHHGRGQQMPTSRRLQRWNRGPFAKANRLKDYDWFWRIEPGAEFPHNVGFDVFRFMRDHNIAYGFTEPEMKKSSLRALSPSIKSFMAQHPDLLHEEANVSWLLENCGDWDSCDGHLVTHELEHIQTAGDNVGTET